MQCGRVAQASEREASWIMRNGLEIARRGRAGAAGPEAPDGIGQCEDEQRIPPGLRAIHKLMSGSSAARCLTAFSPCKESGESGREKKTWKTWIECEGKHWCPAAHCSEFGSNLY